MYDQYAEIEKILPDVTEIKKLQRCSGIDELEETLGEDIRDLEFPLLVVEDDGNGFFSISDAPIDNGYFALFILDKPKTNSSTSRKEKLAVCKVAAVKLFQRMKQGAVEFGNDNPFYGIDFSRIDYDQVGPIGDGYHGYSIGYMFANENFSVSDEPEADG